MTEPTLFDSLAFVERIESLMKDSESVDVEFKSAKGGFPGGFWETYSAFANTQGGTIIFGVKEKD
ncbi:MAG: ATP-binding protein, partial [Alistipes sp.]